MTDAFILCLLKLLISAGEQPLNSLTSWVELQSLMTSSQVGMLSGQDLPWHIQEWPVCPTRTAQADNGVLFTAFSLVFHGSCWQTLQASRRKTEGVSQGVEAEKPHRGQSYRLTEIGLRQRNSNSHSSPRHGQGQWATGHPWNPQWGGDT